MKIAVPYENGQVFQHFGHTALFQLYVVENGAVKESKTVAPSGGGDVYKRQICIRTA